MPEISSVKGTRDFYPKEMAIRNWLVGRVRSVSESFGYQEYEGPYLERLELYAAKSGEELVKEQSYVFPDRNGEMLALRPELTPTLARMIAARVKSLPTPIRWWSYGPCWRYEKPQKGRTREFFQWNIDLLGIDSPAVDAELAAVAATFFRSVGLGPETVRILANSRKLVDRQLANLGVPTERRFEIYHLIDRKEKLSPADWGAYAKEMGVDEDLLRGLRSMLSDRDAFRDSPDLAAFFDCAQALGVSEYLAYDPTIIRGLDYYTGIVFEARDASGAHRAILGGGRYDNLVADVGGDPLPAMGFAMGDVVVSLVMEQAGVIPDLRTGPADVLVTNFNPELEEQGLQLASEIRRAGLKVEWYPESARMGKQLKYADRFGIPIVVIQGPEEIQAGTVTVKEMQTGKQQAVPSAQLPDHLKDLLSG